jgi:phosphoribosylamine--glycine ligase
VVLAAPGYPEATRTGDPIKGFHDLAAIDGIDLYCAGVGPGLVTAGGRVMAVGSKGADLREVRQRIYEAIPAVSWPGMHYRTDIAAPAAGDPRESAVPEQPAVQEQWTPRR